MQSSFVGGDGLQAVRLLKPLILLWLAGTALRVTILAVPPVIPLIHDDLHLSETQVGILIGLPLVLFALAAVPGSLLIARFGAGLTMIIGLVVTAAASASRGAASGVHTLYAATMLMGFGIAIMQPALPTLVRAWLPHRVGLGTAVSTNGMMLGVAMAPALTIPFVLPMVGNSWRLDFLIWAAPVLAAAALFLVLAPGDLRREVRPSAANNRKWWPDWNDPLIWFLGLTFGSNNALYYGVNAFLPDYLNSVGRGDLIGPSIGWLNGAQLLASFVLLATADLLHRRAWPYLVFGPLTLAGVLGVLLGSGTWVVFSAGFVGFALAVTFVVTFSLPPVLSRPDDVHRMVGGMFTISYSCAVIIPILCGALWDLTGIPWTAFLPVGLCGITLTGLGLMLSLRARAG